MNWTSSYYFYKKTDPIKTASEIYRAARELSLIHIYIRKHVIIPQSGVDTYTYPNHIVAIYIY